MPKNGNRPGDGAAISVGKASSAAEPTPDPNLTQVVSGRPLRVDWLRGVADDKRIAVVHRLALIRLSLHRHDEGRCDAVAAEIGIGRASVLGAIDAGCRRGWLLADSKHSGLRFTFPPRNLQGRPLPPAAPTTLPRRAQ